MKNISLNKLLATMAFLIGKPKQELKICVNQLSTKIGIVGKPKKRNSKCMRTYLFRQTLNNEMFMLKMFMLKILSLFFFLMFHLLLRAFACPLTKQEWHLFTNIHFRQEGLPHAPLWRFALLVYNVAQSCKLQMQHCSL